MKNKYDKIAELENMLRSLTKLKTSEDFLDKLESQLDEREAEKAMFIKNDYTNKLTTLIEKFRKPYLIPAVVLIILALIILYFIFLKTETPIDNNKIKTEKQEEIQKENEIKKTPIEEKKPLESISEDKKKIKQKTQQTKTKQKLSPQIPEIEKEEKIEPNKNQLDNLTKTEKNKLPSVVPRDPIKEKEIVKADAKTDSNENSVKNNSFDEKFNLMDKDGLEKLKKKIFKIK